MSNTIDTLGDVITLESFLSKSITDYTDDTITELRSHINFSNYGLITLNLPNLESIPYMGYNTLLSTANIVSVNFPKLKYAWLDYFNSLDIDIFSFPKLRIIHDVSKSKASVINLPELRYIHSSISITSKLISLNLNSLRRLSYISISSTPNLSILEFPRLEYFSGYYQGNNSYCIFVSSSEYLTNSVLRTLDFRYEDFKFINLGGFYQNVNNIGIKFNLILRSTSIPKLRSTQAISSNSNGLNIYVPFFMLSKYRLNADWNHVNYAPYIKSIENISAQSNHSITLDESTIPYYQNIIKYTCSMDADYTDETTGAIYSSSTISYHMKSDIGFNLSSSNVSKSVTETYGSQTLSTQVTQTGIDFNSGYSISNLRTYGWIEHPNPNLLPQGYTYFYSGVSEFFRGKLENGDSWWGEGYTRYQSKYELEMYPKSIVIFINGLTYFDFYLVAVNEGIVGYTGSSPSHVNYAKVSKIYVGNLDEYDVESNYKKLYYDIFSSAAGNGSVGNRSDVENVLSYYWNTAYSQGYTISVTNIRESVPKYWKHIEFDNIDPSTPHFIIIKAQQTNFLNLSGSAPGSKGYNLAIPDTYAYNALPTTIED